MKCYKKTLEEFIDYVFKKYKKDKKVQDFKKIYDVNQQEKEFRKLKRQELIKNQPLNCPVTISSKTANLCINLVNNEIDKSIYMNCYTKEYLDNLNSSLEELFGNYNNAVKKLLEVMKNV